MKIKPAIKIQSRSSQFVLFLNLAIVTQFFLFQISDVSAQCTIETERQGVNKLAFAAKELLYQNRIDNQLYTIVIGSFGMKTDTSDSKLFVLDIGITAPIKEQLIPRRLSFIDFNGHFLTVSDGEGQKNEFVETTTTLYSKKAYYFYLTTDQANFLFSNPIKTIEIFDPRRGDKGIRIKLKYSSLIKEQLECVARSL